MHVRITVSNERLAAHAPVDTIRVVQNIELHPIHQDRRLQEFTESIFVLHYAPTVLVHIFEDETDTGLGPGIGAVETATRQQFSVELKLQDPG